jgi:Reverse transcriptase (RNA-dependent DNA polymerase)
MKGTVLSVFHMASSDSGCALKHCSLLDTGASLHVFNNLRRFDSFRKAPRGDYVLAGSAKVPILGYGKVTMRVDLDNGNKRLFQLHDVAYCPEFVTNIVSYDLLEERGFRWDTKTGQLVRSDDSPVCQIKKKGRYRILEDHTEVEAAFPAIKVPKCRRSAKTPRPKSVGSGILWHLRMGHVGPQVLRQLGDKSLGVQLKGPATHKCTACAGAKIHRIISRRKPDQKPTQPFAKVHLDWTPFEVSVFGFVRAMFLTCELTGMMFVYFCKSYTSNVSLANLKDFQAILKARYSLRMRTIRSDGELAGVRKVSKWCGQEGIKFESSPPNTQDQNGRAEHAGAVIIMKARSMRISAKLPHDLWVDMVNTAVYLHNRTPKAELNWESPYERFYSWLADNHEISGRRKPQLAHLKAYGCRAYAMTGDAQLKKNRLQRLNPRAHIGYLVGYDSTNIFRIWIPHKGEVISSRDVIFDEDKFFDGKKVDLDDGLAATLDNFVHQIKLPTQALRNEVILQEDDEIHDCDDYTSLPDQPLGHSDGKDTEIADEHLTRSMSQTEDEHHDEQTEQSLIERALLEDGFLEQMTLSKDKHQGRMTLTEDRHLEQMTPSEDRHQRRMTLTEDKHLERMILTEDEHSEGQETVLTEIEPPEHYAPLQPTPPPSENSAMEDFVGLTVKNPARFEGVSDTRENVDKLESPNQTGDDRFLDFKNTKIATAWQGAFLKGRKFKAHKRNLPPPPETYRELEKHPLKEAFKEAQKQHLQEHSRKGSRQVIDRKLATGHQDLSSMWVFTYKTDKHGFLVKCRARIVVCGNQQKRLGDLPTRATTLASNTLRTLMAIAAKFDPELKQLDVVNAFVNCDLDELVFMKTPPGFEEQGRICRLKKALYGLRRSPLLWQLKLTDTFRSMGFKEIPQEPCVMMRNGVIVFFYVDDIVFAYRKEHAMWAKKELAKVFELTDAGDLKWFLGIHIIRDRAKRTISLLTRLQISSG